MGVTYDSETQLGYSIEAEELCKPFSKTLKEGYTTEEPRFDSRTGQPIAPQVIQHYPVTECRYKGKLVEETWGAESDSLAGLIAKDLGCEVAYYGNFCSGPNYFAFYLPVSKAKNAYESYKHTIPGDIDYAEVVSKADELKVLGKKLKDIGLNPGKAKVLSVWTVG